MRRLPPFAALRSFEAAARYNNFKMAAEDLCLSASAVSHQVRSLEEYLGVQLFHREKGKPTLTRIGATYLESIQDIFDRLENATNIVTDRGKRSSLVLHLLHSLASCWLLGLMPKLKLRHPDLDIKLLSATDSVEFSTGDIDAAIRYGDGNWLGLRSDFLMEDELFLVCSPDLAERLPPIENLDQLSEHTLIHCSLDPDEWKHWLAAAGNKELPSAHWLDLDSRGLVLEAASAGLGIAIGRMPYVVDYLSNGRLVEPYSVRIKTGKGYYLVYPEHHANFDTVVSLRDWLLDECHNLLK
ncbi:LysR family transcriptional regulator [Amphritea opalescens]|uniref:LysR family transcriptional regulator n=1 Tax=Amphritea opalescens TaxID=2490544 RepID=A0A430KUY1_9GAMM|nr:LysR substrate-binding domain-containing protein [Amphritea opalescens]RTE67321.1 LysR family transcriptional regulator [Amphritea opalescens]